MNNLLLFAGLFLSVSILTQVNTYACDYATNSGCSGSTPCCEFDALKFTTYCTDASACSGPGKVN